MALNFKLTSKKKNCELHFNFDKETFKFHFSLLEGDHTGCHIIDFDPIEPGELRHLIKWLSFVEEEGMVDVGKALLEVGKALKESEKDK